MIAVVASPLALILIVVLIILIAGPHTYYRDYAGPSANWLWLVILLIVVLWLLGVI
jgi:hypothetical protein